MSTYVNIVEIYRGDDRTLRVTIYESDGVTPYLLYNCDIMLYVKKKITDSDENAVITKTGTIIDVANGIVEFYIVPDDTNNLSFITTDYELPFDIKLANNNFTPVKTYTVLRSIMRVVVEGMN